MLIDEIRGQHLVRDSEDEEEDGKKRRKSSENMGTGKSKRKDSKDKAGAVDTKMKFLGGKPDPLTNNKNTVEDDITELER
jgi:hypothetical protein